MDCLIAPDLGPCPEVRTTAAWGKRAASLNRDPGMRRLRRGVYVRHPQPLRPAHRAALLQKHYLARAPGLRVTGLSALELVGLPVGRTLPWVWDSLGGLPTERELEFGARESRAHLAWHGTRLYTQDHGVLVSKSMALGSGPGPWGCRVANPVEALVASADVLSLWRITACLDALMSLPLEIPGVHRTSVLTPQAILEWLDRLPAESARALKVRRALRHTAVPTWSPMESLLRMVVVALGFPAPVMNHPVTIEEMTWWLDLAWPEARVALEYSGDVHGFNPQRYHREVHRSNRLRDSGWNVRTLVREDLADPHRRYAWTQRLAEMLTSS